MAIAKSVWSSRKILEIRHCSFYEGINSCIRAGGGVEMIDVSECFRLILDLNRAV